MKKNIKTITLITFILISVICTIFFNWHAQLFFPSLVQEAEKIAMQIKNGETIETPFYLGVYKIKEVGIRKNTVYLWTDPDPSGPTGFVQHPEGVGFNLWSATNVDDNWAYIKED